MRVECKNAPITGRILKKKEHIFLGPVFGTLTFDYHVCPYCGTGIAESLVFTKHTGPLPVDADEMLECFRESGCKVAMDSVGRIAEIDHEKVKHIFSYDELGFVKPRSEKKVM